MGLGRQTTVQLSSAEEFKESKGKSLSVRKIRLEEGWGRASITAQFSELEEGL